ADHIGLFGLERQDEIVLRDVELDALFRLVLCHRPAPRRLPLVTPRFAPPPRRPAPRHQARIAFCTCSRFSASSHTADCRPSITSSVTSSPRCAGRQCRKMAFASASFIKSGSTV